MNPADAIDSVPCRDTAASIPSVEHITNVMKNIRIILGALGGFTALADVVAAEPPSSLETGHVIGLHELAMSVHRETQVSPSLLGEPGDKPLPLSTSVLPKRLCGTVFGYLPYWESAEHLRYDLLTHLACFSVGVNADGTLGNDRGWPWTAVINDAHANGVKVILVATLFDPAAILTLITTPPYKNAFFVNIRDKMLEGNADGLNIDFEGGGTEWKSHINGFMAELTAYLHAEIPGCEVTFAGPAVNWGNAWDLPGLAASCDGIFIMGYAFSGSWSSTSGPNAPLTGGSINITDTVLDEYGEVTQNNPEKLILGVPYYGGHWTTVSSAPRASVIEWIGSTRFRDDEPNSQIHGLLWDAVSQTPWYRWHDGTNWHQVWFDNAQSLGLKYELAREHDLQGVGMWALGYDGDRDELWNELKYWFSDSCYAPADFDLDFDVDMDDYAHLQHCMAGSNIPQNDPSCQDALLDADNDVDANDLAIFLNCMSGPNTPADPTCGN